LKERHGLSSLEIKKSVLRQAGETIYDHIHGEAMFQQWEWTGRMSVDACCHVNWKRPANLLCTSSRYDVSTGLPNMLPPTMVLTGK
jgi:hypothetical protein